MNKKSSIVAALGEQRLLLPALLNESLAANDRAKYRLTLLQTAKAHAARELSRQSEQADAIRQLLEAADDITDELEEAAFHLTLLTGDSLVEEIRVPLAALARLLVEGSQEYLKAIENARGIQRSGSPDDMRDFLEAIHRIVAI